MTDNIFSLSGKKVDPTDLNQPNVPDEEKPISMGEMSVAMVERIEKERIETPEAIVIKEQDIRCREPGRNVRENNNEQYACDCQDNSPQEDCFFVFFCPCKPLKERGEPFFP